MGKLVAYLGPAMRVATAVEGGSFSLVQQATEYPDGYGLGWYPQDDLYEPVRQIGHDSVASAGPHLSVPRRYSSHCIIASVHKETSPPAALRSIQPFAVGHLLFNQVGTLDRFDEVFRRPLTERLSDGMFRTLGGLSAAELLYANFIDLLADGRGHEAIAGALEQLVGVVSEIGLSAEAPISMAIVVADGRGLVTLRTATLGPPPTLYSIVAEADAPMPASGRVIASEPLFPGSWSALDPNSLIIFTSEPSGALGDRETQHISGLV